MTAFLSHWRHVYRNYILEWRSGPPEPLPARHPGSLLRIDAARAKAEENLDVKYLLRTSDLKMSAEDIALGYRQLLEVARLEKT